MITIRYQESPHHYNAVKVVSPPRQTRDTQIKQKCVQKERIVHQESKKQRRSKMYCNPDTPDESEIHSSTAAHIKNSLVRRRK